MIVVIMRYKSNFALKISKLKLKIYAYLKSIYKDIIRFRFFFKYLKYQNKLIQVYYYGPCYIYRSAVQVVSVTVCNVNDSGSIPARDTDCRFSV